MVLPFIDSKPIAITSFDKFVDIFELTPVRKKEDRNIQRMFLHNRKWTIISLLIIIPIGFYTKFYTGPASIWVNNSMGGILYVIFWSLLIYLIVPKSNPLKIVTFVFIVTGILEFIQLWHPVILEFIRSYFLGRIIIGSSFSWSDFFYYFIGAIIAFLFILFLQRSETETTQNL